MKTVAKKQTEPAPALVLEREVDHLSTGKVTLEGITPDSKIPLMEIYEKAEKEAISSVQETDKNRKEAASLIREQYGVAVKGIVAWAKAGLILLAVRNTFPPRGGFVDWMQNEFPDMSRRSLFNAVKAAEGLMSVGNKRIDSLRLQDTDIINDLAEQAVGKTRRFLLDSAKESNSPETEEEAQKRAEALLALYPEKREYWIPLIEAGERTWVDALRGLSGYEKSTNEDGTRKVRDPYLPFFEKLTSIPASIKHAEKWESIPTEKQPEVIEAAAAIMRFIPPHMRENVLSRLQENNGQEA